jgi:hypothetical protein
MSIGYVVADNGINIPLDSLAKTYTYNGNNDIETITIVYAGVTYVQTFAYTGTNLTSVTQWEAQ